MEQKTLKCPNCGANATNVRNCEYCGSLLVRLVDNGINIDAYLSGHGILPGLLKALKDNLQLQKNNTNEPIATDIYGKYFATNNYNFVSVIPSSNLIFQNGRTAFPSTKGGIGVIFSFIINDFGIMDDKHEVDVEENKRMTKAHDKFKELEIFDLFASNYSKIDKGFVNKSNCYEYAIDFGEDSEGAAIFISDVLNQVYDVPYEAYLKYNTNIGSDAIEKNREENYEDNKYAKYGIGIFIVGLPICYSIMQILANFLGKIYELSFFNILMLLGMSWGFSTYFVSIIRKKDKENNFKG